MVIVAKSGSSRDAAIRDLLENYLNVQERVPNDDRKLTHVSTVLHYPQCVGPATCHASHHRLVRLPLRAPDSLLSAVRSHAYRIPGHSRNRGHADYAGRPLADVVVTALALDTPFTEPELVDLPPVWEQRAADGLWLLTMAASLTHTERAELDQNTLEATLLLDGEVMWHSPDRAQLALVIARRLLVDADAAQNITMLGRRHGAFQDWFHNLAQTSLAVTGGHELTDGANSSVSNAEGRAATRIWAAKRITAHERIQNWIIDGDQTELAVDPPGWLLKPFDDWDALPFPSTQAVPAIWQKRLNDGRVIRLAHGSRSAFWPVTRGTQCPVEQFDMVLAGMLDACPAISPSEVIEAWLSRGPDHPDDDDEPSVQPREMWLHPAEACDLGLIDSVLRDRLIHEVAIENEHRMSVALSSRRTCHRLQPPDLAALNVAASIGVVEFASCARRLGVPFQERVPVWHLPTAEPVVAWQLYRDNGPVLRAFARCLVKAVRHQLRIDVHDAWREAMWHRWRADVEGLDGYV